MFIKPVKTLYLFKFNKYFKLAEKHFVFLSLIPTIPICIKYIIYISKKFNIARLKAFYEIIWNIHNWIIKLYNNLKIKKIKTYDSFLYDILIRNNKDVKIHSP